MVKKAPKCSRGYTCGRSCINKGLNCRNALDGQPKNYAEFLSTKGLGYRAGKELPTGVKVETTFGGTQYIPVSKDSRLYSNQYLERPSPFGVTGASYDVSDLAVGIAGSADRVFSFDRYYKSKDTLEDVIKTGALRDGDVLILRRSQSSKKQQNQLDDLIEERFDTSGTSKNKTFPRDHLIGIYENGTFRKLTPDEVERAKQGAEVQFTRREQAEAIYQEFNRSRGPSQLAAIYEKEDDDARRLAPVEDAWVGRKPNSATIESTDPAFWEGRASEWASRQGFEEGGANGFTATQTKAHDIAHPVTHAMLGMNSRQIHAMLGAARSSDGKPSLIAEEAIVNVVEHLSRGDSFDASVVNGLRLARATSRAGSVNEQEVVRSRGFREALTEMADRVYRNDNFSDYMTLVRASNRVSKTVAALGDDFTNSATGG